MSDWCMFKEDHMFLGGKVSGLVLNFVWWYYTLSFTCSLQRYRQSTQHAFLGQKQQKSENHLCKNSATATIFDFHIFKGDHWHIWFDKNYCGLFHWLFKQGFQPLCYKLAWGPPICTRLMTSTSFPGHTSESTAHKKILFHHGLNIMVLPYIKKIRHCGFFCYWCAFKGLFTLSMHWAEGEPNVNSHYRHETAAANHPWLWSDTDIWSSGVQALCAI